MAAGGPFGATRVAGRVALVGAALGVVAACGGAGGAPPAPPPPVAPAVAPPTAASAGPGVEGPSPVTGPALPASAPVGLEIPALGVRTAAFVPLGLAPDGSMTVPQEAGTAGWYTGAPAPGALGPAVIAAHVDWKGEAGLFADLVDTAPGDEVRVVRADGWVAVFRVDRVERFPKDRFPTEAVYGSVDHAGLRLITCGGEFDEDRGSHRDNVVAFAALDRVHRGEEPGAAKREARG